MIARKSHREDHRCWNRLGPMQLWQLDVIARSCRKRFQGRDDSVGEVFIHKFSGKHARGDRVEQSISRIANRRLDDRDCAGSSRRGCGGEDDRRRRHYLSDDTECRIINPTLSPRVHTYLHRCSIRLLCSCVAFGTAATTHADYLSSVVASHADISGRLLS